MSIDKDPKVFEISVVIIMGLLSALGLYRARIMSGIKKNIDDLFTIGHKNSENIVKLETLIDERTGKKKSG